jgi:hypothetical protein
MPAARADNRTDLCIDVETTDKREAKKKRKEKERYAKRDEERDER